MNRARLARNSLGQCSMDVTVSGQRRLGFGLFEANLATHKLYRRGVLVHLQDKPFQILAMLLERPGEVVTREELQERLWPRDTFVEFDQGLNTAIRKLRYALGDSSENPTFVETIPRRGYRLIAPVRVLNSVSDHKEAESGISLFHSSALPPEAHSQQEVREAEWRSAIRTVPANTGHRFRLTVATLVALGVGFGAGYLRHARGPEKVMHFSVPLSVAVRDLSLSHNGRVIAFIAPLPKEGGTALWVLEVGSSRSRPLENTAGASYPFWSPDDRSIGFFADGKLKKIEAGGGPVQIICDAPIGRGGTWNRADVIVFAADSGVGMRRVSASGGQTTILPGFAQKVATTLSNRWPIFLPDGKHFLYSSIDFGADLQGESSAIYIAALDSSEHRRLATSNANAAYVSPNYLLFLRNGTLMVQHFDTDRLQLTGEPRAVVNDVEYLSSVARALFSVSDNGTLVYQGGSGATFTQLSWFDREGKELSVLGAPARYANPRLSPDDKRVAVDIDDPQSSNNDVWIIEANHEVRSRFSFDPAQDETPLWSHDGRRILWLSDRGGKNGFYLKTSDGSAMESPTLPLGVALSFASAPSDWSSDERFLLYSDLQEGSALHLWVLPMNEDRPPFRLLPSVSADVDGQFSPDGRWVAYSSNESGKWQVYVTEFQHAEEKYQISTDGGQQPRWRHDGKELFYLSPDRKLMAVSVNTRPRFEFRTPKLLFVTQAHDPVTAEEFFTYDVSADGQRFLINVNAERNDIRPADIILNWALQLGN